MIELKGVTVSYSADAPALKNADLCIERGEFVFIVGPTGAGKSTLLRLLYRGEKVTEGAISVAGYDLNTIANKDVPYFRRKIGIVFQDYGLLPNKTVWENIAFALRVTGAGRSETRRKVQDALEKVGMTHRPDALPGEISGGEQQRVAIARAIVNEPDLMLADEPTGNLDPDTSMGIVQLLKFINERGTTVLVATHDAPIVDSLQKRVVAIVDGSIVRDDERGLYRHQILAGKKGGAN